MAKLVVKVEAFRFMHTFPPSVRARELAQLIQAVVDDGWTLRAQFYAEVEEYVYCTFVREEYDQ